MKKLTFILLFFYSFQALADGGNCGPYNEETQTYGDNCQWTYDATTKTLTISGNGAMADTKNCEANPHYIETYPKSAGFRTTAPWGIYSDEIETINVQQGITSLGNRAFQGLDHVTNINLPDGLETIGSQAFDRVTSVESIIIPQSVNTVGYAAFAWTASLTSLDVSDGFEGINGKNPFYGVGETNSTRVILHEIISVATVYCNTSQSNTCDSLNFDNVVPYKVEANRYVLNDIKYKTVSDMLNGIPVKRIYTIDEANQVSGKINTFTIRYR